MFYILQTYKKKEKQVKAAENDQENELALLNEQISSQNVESINLTVMNCKYSSLINFNCHS
jgi:hypothetical protein